MPSQVTVHALPASGQFSLPVPKASIQNVMVAGVDVVFTLKDGSRHVVQGLALRAMTDPSLRVLLTDAQFDGPGLIQAAGKIHLDAILSKAASSEVQSTSGEHKNEAKAPDEESANRRDKHDAQQEDVSDPRIHQTATPPPAAPDAGMTRESQNHKDDNDARLHEQNHDRSPSVLIIAPSGAGSGSGGTTNNPPPPPVAVAHITVAAQVRNTEGQEFATINGHTQITGAGGAAHSASDLTPATQAAREVINGTSGDDIIRGDGAGDMGSGFARVIDIHLTGQSAVTVVSVSISGLPPGFVPLGATQNGDSWDLTLPEDLASNGNHLSVTIQYPIASDSQAFNPTTFEMGISATGYVGVELITGQLTIPAIIQDVRSADDMSYSVGGRTGAVFPAFGLGDDIRAGDGNDTVQGLVGHDLIIGGAGDDSLDGGAGNDLLDGGTGADTLIGGTGQDTASYSHSSDGVSVDLLSGQGQGGDAQGDVLQGIEHLTGSALGDSLAGDAGANTLDGGAGDDVLTGRGGADMIIGALGIDTAVYLDSSSSVNVSLVTGQGAGGDADGDTLVGIENITGSAYADVLTGDANDNMLDGQGGNDTLQGGAGADILMGGAGTDTASYNTSTEAVSVSLATGQGTGGDAEGDELQDIENLTGSRYADELTGNNSANRLDGGAGNDWLEGGAGADSLVGGMGTDAASYLEAQGSVIASLENAAINTGEASGDSYSSIENLEGSEFADTLIGDANANVLIGGPGGDNLQGRDGDDTLIGGAEADTLDGGNGLDTASYANSNEGVDVDLSNTGPQTGGDADGDLLTNVENLIGSRYGDRLVGDAGDNTLNGGAGSDTLLGGAGADRLIGGGGVDTVDYSTSIDAVNINLVANTATGGDATGDTFSSMENVVGGLGSDTLTGDSGNNQLTGNDGDDALTGNAGNDSLYGGQGADTLEGGSGSDLISGGLGTDTASYANSRGAVQVNLATGVGSGGDAEGDTFNSVENLNGSAQSDLLIGDAGVNRLDGGLGDDTLEGGGGADVLMGGTGSNFASYAGSSIGLNVSLDAPNTNTGDAQGDGYNQIQNLIGSAYNDTLSGDTNANIIQGGAGNDTLAGLAGADTLQGGDGIDTADYSASIHSVSVHLGNNVGLGGDAEGDRYSGIENLIGTASADTLTGNAADNRLDGADGDDTLQGGAGADTLVGGNGADTASYSEASIGLVANLASPASNTGDAAGDVYSGIEHLQGSSYNDSLVGDAQANRLDGGSGNDMLQGGLGADTLLGGAGQDVASYAGASTGIYASLDQPGDNTGEASGDVYSSIEGLLGSANADTLVGDANANSLSGDAGDDLLIGGLGADTISGGQGTDTLSYAASAVAVRVDLVNGGNTGGDADGDIISGIENLIGSNQNDTLIGDANANRLEGGLGSDNLDGGTGADTLLGGAGDDSYVVDDAGDVVTELANQGTDIVRASINYALTGNVENLTLTGSANIDATGNTLDNLITGNTGNNTLDGGLGADTMAGGAGDDRYVVDNAGDVVSEAASAGSDTVQTSLNYTLGSDVENLTLTGSANLSGTGNELDNVLTGNSGNNTLDGGAGADTMVGGAGNDSYLVDNAGDVITENASEGTDNVQASVSYTLGDNVENLSLGGSADLNGTGNALANILTGNSGNNTLDGGAGADTLVGGQGNDIYVVNDSGDVTTENASEGTDTVQASLNWTLAANIENLTLTSSANLSATGNTLDNVIIGNVGNNTLDGGTGADTMAGGLGDDSYVVDNANDVINESASEGTDTVLTSSDYALGNNLENLTLTGSANLSGTGNALDNTLIGNSGNNTLDGGAGADTLTGGLGDDLYLVDNSGDVITENAAEGNDTVQASISYTLGDNIESLVLTGTGNLNATGNALDNQLTGNNGNNTLDGGAGADTMAGGLGNDTYVIDNSGDIVNENTTEGTDLIQASVSYTLSANVENLTLTGSANIDATGNTQDNVLTGNAGNNTLDGSTGADTLIGGLGDDIYVVDNAGDVTTESASEGTDLVRAGLSWALGANIENLTLTGSGNFNATGNSLANQLTGNSGNNTLDGGAGADTMAGGVGNDSYVVDNIADVITEGASEGTDSVSSSVSYSLNSNVENLTLTGTANINATGNTQDNALSGNSGDNTLDGGAGADTMAGGAGNDNYIVDDAGDLITEASNQGTDSVQSSVSYTLGANLENLTLTGPANLNATGNSQANNLTGNTGDNTLDGDAGADTMAGGLGNDTYVVDNAADVITEGNGEGTDTVRSSVSYALGSNLENLTLTGANNLNATGNALDNVLTGNAGNNALDGGAGADTMAGGLGDDSYVVDNLSDVVAENSAEGNDTISASVSYTLSANVENLTLTGTANLDATGNTQDNILTGNSGDNTLDGGAGADTLIGGAGNDTYLVDSSGDVITEASANGTDNVQAIVSYTLSANVENLTLTGSANLSATGNTQANILTGNSGNNTLDGGAGADTLIGSLGDDSYVVDNAGDVITENASEGTDTVQSSISYTLGGNLENLTLTGSANLSATGNNLDNALTGNSGNNTLDGGTGADSMAGGLGNDNYVVDNAGDVVTEAASAGTDLVLASVSYSLAVNIENLTLTGSANLSGTGNDQANTLTGNTGDNTLDGGLGSDTLVGGLGNDIYLVDNTGDVITETNNEGSDTVQSGISWTLGSNLEALTLTGSANVDGTGNTLDNTLTGNSGNNTLDGASGADTMAGGLGNDIYIVDNSGDVITENASEGTDTVVASVSYTLGNNVEALTLSGSGSLNATGNTLDNTLTGNNGDNALDGAAGADTMAGGLGNDSYVVDNAGDVIVENASEGADGVSASVSYTLSANIENLTLTGSTNLNATGNALANTLTGNSGNNTLDGSTGTDTMAGGQGNDTYVVDNSSDVVTENTSEGNDTVQASASYTLSANVEALTLTGYANINATGNELANTLVGNTGNNVLDGGSGADTMTGGLGDDTYAVDSASDVITENASEGTDTVLSAISYALGNNLENLTLTGSTNLSATGNSLANVIAGNSGNNVIDGGSGADTMSGGVGDDSYTVDSTTDVIIENASEGNDQVLASASYTLSDNVESLTLTGSSNIDGTGSAQANTLTGNSGNNVLDGGAGADTMAGGLGNDTYVIDDAGDALTENASAGTDTVMSAISWTLASNFENLTLTGSANINGTGNAVANIITGNSGNNVLTGGGGADTLSGGAGDDTFIVSDSSYGSVDGGAGLDTLKLDGMSVSNLTSISSKTSNIEALDFNGNTSDALTVNATDVNRNGFLGADANGRLDIITNAVSSPAGQDIVFMSSSEYNNVLTPTAAAAVTLVGGSAGLLFTAVSGSQANVAVGANALILPTLSELGSTWGLTADPSVTSIANMYTWLDATDLDGDGVVEGASESGQSAGAIATWVDKSGNANNLTQATATAKPTYVLANTNGLASISFDGGDYLTSTKNIGNVYTVFSVGQMQGTQNARLVGSSTGANNWGLGWDATYEDRWMTAGGNNGSTASVTTALKLYSGTSTGTVDTLYSNGQKINSFNSVTSLGLLELGGSGGAANLSKGNMDEVLVFTRALTDAERVIVEGYLRDKWAVSGNTNALTALGSYGSVGFDTTWTSAKLIFGTSGADTLTASYNGISARGTNKMDAVLFGGAGDDSITGGTRVDALYGAAGNDTLDGGAGSDWMTGGTGNDTYVVDDAADVVTENANEGTDTILSSVTYTLLANIENLTLTGSAAINATGNSLDNVLTGNIGANYLTGGAGNDTLNGDQGADTLDGGTGNDVMAGGQQNDLYIVDSTSDVINENASEGTDTVQSSVTYTLSNNVENLTLTGATAINGTGNSLDNVLTGNSAANTLTGGAGNDVLDGGTGADNMVGGTGNDIYMVDNASDVVTENASEGTDTVVSTLTYTIASGTTNVENIALAGSTAINGTGNNNANLLVGNLAANTLTGGGGDDTLNGQGGVDTMVGGTGNDTYWVDSSTDVVTENAAEGTDTEIALVSTTLSSNVENLVLQDSLNLSASQFATLPTVTVGGDMTLQAWVYIPTAPAAGARIFDTNVTGSDNVTLYLNTTRTLSAQIYNGSTASGTQTSSNTVAATGWHQVSMSITQQGVSTIYIDGVSGGSSTLLTPTDMARTFYIGRSAAGNYTTMQIADVRIWDKALTQAEIVATSTMNGLTGNESGLVAWHSFNGSANSGLISGGSIATLSGTAAFGDAMTATGNTQDNYLTGNSGANTLSGGTGVDTMAGGAGNDTYVVDNTGDVVVETSTGGTADLIQSSVTYTLSAEVEKLTLTGATAINAYGNTLANTLTGNTADNILDGGSGIDTMIGGTGNDTYYVDNAADAITENASEGTDLVYSSVTYTLPTNVDNITLTGSANVNATGNALNNVLTGNTGDNTLDGSTGSDTMVGGLGNDTYVVDNSGDVVTEYASEGTDLVKSSITYTLGSNVENLTLTGATAINGTGNTLDNYLTGNTAVNTLTGGSGNDTLDGGTGADVLVGGTGNDTYYVDNTSDTITENAGEGTDQVYSTVTYTLAANVDNLTLTGAAVINGTGNTLDNVLTGNSANNTLTGSSGNDTLDGGAGADALVGGIGNDTYYVDSVSDTITENAAEGTDLVYAAVTYTLSNANTENLTLTGSANNNATGNALANILTGNSGDNVLTGGTGADTMIGGTGNDTYYVDNVGDSITENASEGTDQVYSSVTYTLASNVDHLTLTGATAINATGNTLDNYLIGNSAVNTLTGSAGNDTLDGGASADAMIGGTGNDTYFVDNASDAITENTNEGTDTVQSSLNYTLGSNVENLTLAGSTNLNGTGNSLANVLTGNSGNNVLTSGGGVDTFDGAAGNDTLIATSDANLSLADGGLGDDTLQLSGVSLSFDLGSLMGKVQNMETVDLRDSANTASMTVALNNVISLTDARHDLSIHLDSGDTLTVSGEKAVTSDTTDINGVHYVDYALYSSTDHAVPPAATLHAIFGT